MSYTLYGKAGFGSVCVEAALELVGAEYDFVEADPLGDEADQRRVRAINPAGQVPALILPDDSVMTESAAILIWLGDRYPEAGIAPAIDAPERAEYLRWMLFLAASIYSTFTLSDGPERFHPDPATHETLLALTNQRRNDMWTLMNDAFDGAPGRFLLGDSLSLLDVYVAMMCRWSPGRSSFARVCRALLPVVEATEADPIIAEVWARNFRRQD
ncbi:glutathione S-transferase N-terminal domain-containing protein [Maricaulis maris]|uniref:GST-like protein n=1 Tax=Maricaulis maris TaxID=74318 RepID=A0A495D184_9PROT|nr:glutathione S-transferase N-terminal domain-containing protein [Maricaulis maris]RKQ94191.1 GST-like protein [Maricaulis maris]